jgi:hypothetical protein
LLLVGAFCFDNNINHKEGSTMQNYLKILSVLCLVSLFLTGNPPGVNGADLYPAADGTYYYDYYKSCDYFPGGGCESGEDFRISSGILVYFNAGGRAGMGGSYYWTHQYIGILEFNIAGVRALFTRDLLKAELTLTVKNNSISKEQSLSVIDIQDVYENGVIETGDISTSTAVDAVYAYFVSGDKVTFDVTSAVVHDLFDQGQSDFTGFYIKNVLSDNYNIEFYDHTDPSNGPLLRIQETFSSTTTSVITTTTTTVTPVSTTTTVPPTIIELSSFTATPKAGNVILQWSTESETDNAGFNLYRSKSADGEYSKINSTLIPAQGSSTQGASYEFTDTNVQNRKTCYYKLEDIALNGTSTMHGPVSAKPRLIYGIGK